MRAKRARRARPKRVCVVGLHVRAHALGEVFVGSRCGIRRDECARFAEDPPQDRIDARAIDAAAERAVQSVPEFVRHGHGAA
jgi:hypothetical protein